MKALLYWQPHHIKPDVLKLWKRVSRWPTLWSYIKHCLILNLTNEIVESSTVAMGYMHAWPMKFEHWLWVTGIQLAWQPTYHKFNFQTKQNNSGLHWRKHFDLFKVVAPSLIFLHFSQFCSSQFLFGRQFHVVYYSLGSGGLMFIMNCTIMYMLPTLHCMTMKDTLEETCTSTFCSSQTFLSLWKVPL